MSQRLRLLTSIHLILFSLLTASLCLLGCEKKKPAASTSVPVVEVVSVVQKDAPIFRESIASTDGFINATIRAQVTGYLINQLYKEGELVKKGQLLFKIDPRTFEANVAQAKADLARLEADWKTARLNLNRIKPLAERNAVSQKDLDDATGAEQTSKAAVLSAKAALKKAQLDLSFTNVRSPIDGIAGNAKAQIGDLVGPNQNEPLTTVSTLDPIKVYIPVSEQEYLRSWHKQSSMDEIPLTLILSNGETYPRAGKIVSADRQIDEKTGTLLVLALFPNPDNFLRPGQFAKVRAMVTIKKNALLIPQRAVTEMQGIFQVAVVGQDNKIEVRNVTPGERVDAFWIIDQGLNPGDVVVAEGAQKVRPGMTVKTQPFSTTTSTAADAAK